MLRGTASGLEFAFGDAGGFDEAAATVCERLADRPDFYYGSTATAVFDGQPPDGKAFASFIIEVRALGIEIRGIYGPDDFASFAQMHALSYLGPPPHQPVVTLEEKREERAVRLSEESRALEADFAGARADFAGRRKARIAASALSGAPLGGTLYHRGTLRGGQSLQHIGNVVLIGDVNPGAELVAGGDVVVVGSLLGTAHAGAQGDDSARVIAIEMMPTQLRIATYIAVDDTGRRPSEPEEAYVKSGRIVIASVKAGPR
jgi:septum site-determining protein MinC